MTSAPGTAGRDPAGRERRDRGAAAVEFALVMPLLLTLALGIAEFGRAYNVQTTLSAAAREGVRSMALKNDVAAAQAAAKSAAAPAVSLSGAQIVVSPSACTTGATATVTVTYPMPYLTSFFGSSITLTGKGAMRCHG